MQAFYHSSSVFFNSKPNQIQVKQFIMESILNDTKEVNLPYFKGHYIDECYLFVKAVLSLEKEAEPVKIQSMIKNIFDIYILVETSFKDYGLKIDPNKKPINIQEDTRNTLIQIYLNFVKGEKLADEVIRQLKIALDEVVLSLAENIPQYNATFLSSRKIRGDIANSEQLPSESESTLQATKSSCCQPGCAIS